MGRARNLAAEFEALDRTGAPQASDTDYLPHRSTEENGVTPAAERNPVPPLNECADALAALLSVLSDIEDSTGSDEQSYFFTGFIARADIARWKKAAARLSSS